MIKIYQQNKKGSVLAFALLILGMMFAVVASLTVITTQEGKDAGSTDASAQAYQVADSGVQTALQKINTAIQGTSGPLTPISSLFNCGGNELGAIAGSYKLNFYSDANASTISLISDCSQPITKIKAVKSTGIFQNTVRAVSTSVKINCKDACCGLNSITDTRGSESITYPLVAIGTGANGRCWFGENLRTTKNLDGSNLALSPGGLTQADYICNTGCGSPWGLLYSWTAAMRTNTTAWSSAGASGYKAQGICPTGWHVPSAYDASVDDVALMGSTVSGNGYALEKVNDSTIYWSPSSATNSSGFGEVAAGYYYMGFSNHGTQSYTWTSSAGMVAPNQINPVLAYDFTLNNNSSTINMYSNYAGAYYESVRCVMD